MQQRPRVRHFKPREERLRTALPARMREGTGWSDACILNVSSRGLMIYAKCTPRPGSHVDIRRGGELVSAGVIWRKNHRIGLCAHGQLPVETIISGDTAAAAVPAITGGTQIERRKQRRDPDRSRARSRAIEFMSLVLIGTALAGAAAAYVQQTLANPVSAVNRALGSR